MTAEEWLDKAKAAWTKYGSETQDQSLLSKAIFISGYLASHLEELERQYTLTKIELRIARGLQR